MYAFLPFVISGFIYSVDMSFFCYLCMYVVMGFFRQLFGRSLVISLFISLCPVLFRSLYYCVLFLYVFLYVGL